MNEWTKWIDMAVFMTAKCVVGSFFLFIVVRLKIAAKLNVKYLWRKPVQFHPLNAFAVVAEQLVSVVRNAYTLPNN